jgi:hypothetical protein
MTNLRKSPVSVRPGGINGVSSAAQYHSPQFSASKIKQLVAELEVPFPTSLIVWRVMNINAEGTRGQIAPYADPRAYTDRLNALFTPAGWTRRYTVTTSANFERSKDKKLVAKVFVTCDLTIFGIGSHAATGEEWADDDNAGTSAEAQAFKRACACFGLGRYLYSFTGFWVDLDEQKHPVEKPQVFGWATPQGWRQGLRPAETEPEPKTNPVRKQDARRRPRSPVLSPQQQEIVRQIEEKAEGVGKHLYRRILASVARVWSPDQIGDTLVLEKVLGAMLSAEEGLRRLEEAKAKIGSEDLKQVLSSLKLRSLDRVDNLDTLGKVVAALEDKAGLTAG